MQLLANVRQALREQTNVIAGMRSLDTVTVSQERTTLRQALQLPDKRPYRNKRLSRNVEGEHARELLVAVLRERSETLAEHANSVARLAADVAQRLGLPKREVRLVELAAVFHDVGKTAIPDTILSKPGPLDELERWLMNQHTIIGERILAASPSLAAVASLVRATHERIDGTGYPDGLRGEEIPLGARIVAVVDAYDAMISQRPYRLPLTSAQAVDEIRRCVGTQFDRRVADVFIAGAAGDGSADVSTPSMILQRGSWHGVRSALTEPVRRPVDRAIRGVQTHEP